MYFKSKWFTLCITPSGNDAIQSNRDVMIMSGEAGWNDVIAEDDRNV